MDYRVLGFLRRLFDNLLPPRWGGLGMGDWGEERTRRACGEYEDLEGPKKFHHAPLP